MAKFFSGPKDLLHWIKSSFETEVEAAGKIKEIVGSGEYETDIAQSLKSIFSGDNAEQGAKTIFRVLAIKGVVDGGKIMSDIKNSSEQKTGLEKKAHVERFPERMMMDLRVCPKLPRQGASQGQVSTYNCRRFCSESIVLDDDPNRMYCAEALWRRHVMDKFSREWLDPKTGLLQGGYINDRFVVCRDERSTGEPMNSPRMSLKPGERTRQPKPYEYSTERRLEEQRDKGSTKSIVLNSSSENSNVKVAFIKSSEIPAGTKIISLAARHAENPENKPVDNAFAQAIEMHIGGVAQSEALDKIASDNNIALEKAAIIQDMAIRKFAAHKNEVYKISSLEKKAYQYFQVRPGKQVEVKNITTNQIEKLSYSPSQVFEETGANVFQLKDLSSGDVRGPYQVSQQDDSLQPVGIDEVMNNFKKQMQAVSEEVGLSETGEVAQEQPVEAQQPIESTFEIQEANVNPETENAVVQ